MKLSGSLSVIICAGMIITICSSGYTQVKTDSHHSKSKRVQLEFPGGNYLVSPREKHATSPAYRYYTPGFTVVQVNVDNDGNNIMNDAANEPSIAFDPNDPNRIAIGWRQFDDISSDFRQAGFGYTSDAGQTWTFTGVIDPGIFRSDPVLGSDAEGNFYYNSLTLSGDQYWCNVYKSYDGGGTWEMGTFAQGGDKQWMTIDRTGGIGAGNIYEFWSAASSCEPYYFTRSTDGNISYEPCSTIPGDPYWGTTLVSPEGNLYIGGAQWGGFLLAKSTNAQDPEQLVSWDYYSLIDLDGEIVGWGGDFCPNPVGLLGQTIIAMDTSGGPGDGNLYILCSVARYSTSDPCDVMFARSLDDGITWSLPVRVNDDPGNDAYQWFGTMSVAPDGRIDVIWLDTREFPGTVYSSLYYAYSLDEGATWSANVPLSEGFNPHIGWPVQQKMGDYFDMYSDEAGAHLAWAATFNGEEDVYYSVIKPSFEEITEQTTPASVSVSQNFPNPFREKTTIRYYLSGKKFVSIAVYTLAGVEVTSLVHEIQGTGFHETVFNASGLESGIYYYRLKAGEFSETRRLLLLK